MLRFLFNRLTERSVRIDIGHDPVKPELLTMVFRTAWNRRCLEITIDVPMVDTIAIENSIVEGLADFAKLITTPSSFIITISGLPLSAFSLIARLSTLTPRDENDESMRKLVDALASHGHEIG